MRCIRSYAEALYIAVLGEGRSGPSPALEKLARMVPSCGPLRMLIWCGRRELNPHGLAACGFSYHFGFRRPAQCGFVVRTIPSPFPSRGLGAARLVSTPSRMCLRAWLGIAIAGFPDFEQFYAAGFPMGTQLCLSPLRLPFRHARVANLSIKLRCRCEVPWRPPWPPSSCA
jgi:hypothetical protein